MLKTKCGWCGARYTYTRAEAGQSVVCVCGIKTITFPQPKKRAKLLIGGILLLVPAVTFAATLLGASFLFPDVPKTSIGEKPIADAVLPIAPPPAVPAPPAKRVLPWIQKAADEWIAQGKLLNFATSIPNDHCIGTLSRFKSARILDGDSLLITHGSKDEEALLIRDTVGMVDNKTYTPNGLWMVYRTEKVGMTTMFVVLEFDAEESREIRQIILDTVEVSGDHAPEGIDHFQ